MTTCVRDVKFIDARKKLDPSKHYVYLIGVTYVDGVVQMIRRRYSQFFDLQCSLLDNFPNEAGGGKDVNRSLPLLPGKIIFGRSHVRQVAMKRLKVLEDYCNALIALPPHISQCDEVLEFFRPSKDDICPSDDENTQADGGKNISISDPWQPEQFKVLSDHQARGKNQLSVGKGAIVEAIEKNDSGWWLVRLDDQIGWLPGTFLGDYRENSQLSGCDNEKYVTIEAYVAKNADELSFIRGVVLEVLDKNATGWWLARYKGNEGLVPGVYLKEFKTISTSPQLRTENTRKSYSQENTASESITNAVSANIPSTNLNKTCQIIADFQPESPNCIQLKAGQEAKVLQEDDSGWWYLCVGEEKGWAPASHLELLSTEAENIYHEIEDHKESPPLISPETRLKELSVDQPHKQNRTAEETVKRNKLSISDKIKLFESLNI